MTFNEGMQIDPNAVSSRGPGAGGRIALGGGIGKGLAVRGRSKAGRPGEAPKFKGRRKPR